VPPGRPDTTFTAGSDHNRAVKGYAFGVSSREEMTYQRREYRVESGAYL
jgi:hypothetical protein